MDFTFKFASFYVIRHCNLIEPKLCKDNKLLLMFPRKFDLMRMEICTSLAMERV